MPRSLCLVTDSNIMIVRAQALEHFTPRLSTIVLPSIVANPLVKCEPSVILQTIITFIPRP